MQLQKYNKDVYTIANFLSIEQCEKLISISEQLGYEEAKVNMSGRQTMMKSVRDNERLLHFNDGLATLYWNQLKTFHREQVDGMEAFGLNELFRFYKYQNNQRFKRHKDGSYRKNDREWSVYTFMLYLNDAFTGGATSFDAFSIQPLTGTALIFKHDVRHEGVAVEEGIKYVLRTDIMYRKLDKI